MRRLKKVLKRVGYVVLGLVALAAIGAIGLRLALETDWGRDKVRGQLESAIGDRLNGSVSVGELEGDVLSDLVARDLVIHDRQGRVVASADRIVVRYEILSLLESVFDAKRVEVHGLEVIDRGNLGELIVESDQPSTWSVDIDEVVVSNGRYRREREGAEPLEVSAISAEGSVDHTPANTFARLVSAAATFRDRRVSLTGDVSYSGGEIDVLATAIETGESAVTISTGTLSIAELAFRAEVSAAIAAADIRELGVADWLADVELGGQVSREPGAAIAFQLRGGGAGAAFEAAGRFDPETLAASGRIAVSRLDPSAWIAGAPAGQMAISISDVSARNLDAGIAGLRASGRVEAGGEIAGGEIAGLSASVAARGGTLTAEGESRLLARGPRLERARFAATMDIGERRIEVELDAARATSGSIALVAPSLRGSTTLAEPIEASEFRARFEARRASAAGRVFTAVVATASRDRGAPIRVRLSANNPETGARAEATATVKIGEEVVAVNASALELTTGELHWRGSGRAEIRSDGAIAIDRLALTSSAGRIELEGVYRDGRAAPLEASAERLDLDRLSAAIPELPEMSGVVDGKITARGPLDLRRLRATGAVEVDGLRWAADQPPISGSVSASIDAGQLELEGEVTAKELGSATVSVALDTRRPLSWRSLGNRDLERLAVELRDVALADALERFGVAPIDAEGKASGTARIGDAGRFEIDLRIAGLRGKSGLARFRGPVDVELTGTAGDRSIEGELAVFERDGLLLRARGEITASITELAEGATAAPIEVVLEAPTLELARLSELVDLGVTVTGSIDLTASIDGTLESPEASIAATGRDLRSRGAEIDSLVLGAKINRSGWKAEATLAHQGGSLRASGDGGYAAESPLRAHLETRAFDIAALSPALASADVIVARVGGRLTATVDVDGTARRPGIEGELGLRDGTMRMRTGLDRLDNISLDAELRGGRLTATGGGEAGKGSIQLDLDATITGAAPPRLDGDIELLEVPIRGGGYRARASGDIALDGAMRDGELVIAMAVDSGFVRMPERISERDLHPTGELADVRYVGPRGVAERRREQESGLGAPPIRYKITTPGGFRVIGDAGARLHGDSELEIGPAGDDVSITGVISARTGRISLFDRRYQVRRATIDFQGATPPNPALDVSLAHEFDTLSLFIEVRGDLVEPEVSFESSPSGYSRAELLSFVLGDEPGQQSAGGDSSLRAGAASVASSFLAGKLEELVKRPLPFDTVRIESSEEDAQGISSVLVGRWLFDDVFVAYQRRFDAEENENSNEAVLEYHFLPRWVIEGVAGDRGAGSVDLLWVRRF
jgi:autotransporter translocation and assembly factor TamB